MQINFRKLCTSSALAVLILQSANLIAAEGEFYLAPGFQWMNFDDEWHLDEGTGYFFGLGYDFTDQWSAEFNIADSDPEDPNGDDHDVDLWKLDVLYGLNTRIGPLQPFLVTGLGNANIAGGDESLWNYGGGFRWDFSDRVSIRTALRNFHIQGRDLEDNEVGIETALIFRFGGARRPAATPAPAVAESRAPAAAPEPDADGDGVPDSRDACPDTPRNYAVDSRGCPIPVEEVARVELDVLFEFDRAEVRAPYFPEIQEVADFMNQYPDVIVELEGHTDSVGTESYNLDLSQRRADAVRQVLIDRYNIQASRISATGYGESQPVASNETPAGREQNRRVITVIIKTLQNYRPR
ncbi:MAG: OmpA family protein [Gammaproteobacteria bacterium]|nr:OmpA family protein [Pseudomonadales bacterium]MCP5345762.1 OmpA family protein [Pseudomonadales bacterium]